MGPVAVTREEIDIADTPISCYVNGELRQSSNTGLLIFDIPTIIETLSAGITLQPGDIIATGTPAGVGIGFDPPKYLKAGDVVRIEIGGIGVLENRSRGAFLMTSVHVRGMTIDSEGEGPPIVMLHGLGGTSNSFQPHDAGAVRLSRHASRSAGRRPLADAAAEDHRCDRWSKRSSTPPCHLGVSRAHVVGHSMGTLIASISPRAIRSWLRA